MLEDAHNRFRLNQEHILKEYQHFLRFATISSEPDPQELDECVDWLEDYLSECGLSVELWGESGKKIVFAQSPHQDGKETLLLYGHYDVQPVDPLADWISPPFEPVIRDERIYARGACDDKGQIFYTIVALKAYYEKQGSFPVNIKLLIEGEEEFGSASLSHFLKEKKEVLQADHVLIVDGMMEEDGSPAISLGARGIVCLSVTLKEASMDLHSGNVGGIAYNPNKAMVELLSTLYRHDGTVNVSGFYDEIIEPLPSEKEELDFDFDAQAFKNTYGFMPSALERGINPLELAWIRPTLEINGIEGGYAGTGFKTVIPSKATANISCRLVPKQDPKRMAALITEHLHHHAPKNMEILVEVREGDGAGFRISGNTKIAKLMATAYETIFERPCKKVMLGGSVPIAADLIHTSGGEGLIVGLCTGKDAIHAPNESFSLDLFEKGYLSIYQLLTLLGND